MNYYMGHLSEGARECIQLSVNDLRSSQSTLDHLVDRLQFLAINYPRWITKEDAASIINSLDVQILAFESIKSNLDQVYLELSATGHVAEPL